VQIESVYKLVEDRILLFTEKTFYKTPDKMNKLLLLDSLCRSVCRHIIYIFLIVITVEKGN